MKQIYNEGRVAGLSAYEIYVRQQLAEDPSVELPSEREWLSTMFAAGNSMILKIPLGTSAGYHDFPLPENSALAACSSITATVFTGKAKFDDEDTWAIKVTDYGQLITNNYNVNPETPGETVPTLIDNDKEFDPSDNLKTICTEYLKIIDGIVYQPGTWTDYMKDGVGKEFTPNMEGKGVVRLWLSEETENNTYVMLHGFAFKTVMSGTVGFDSGMDTASPQNGDFLGPMSYPWAVKIAFMVSNDVYAVVNKQAYERILPGEEIPWQDLDYEGTIDSTYADQYTITGEFKLIQDDYYLMWDEEESIILDGVKFVDNTTHVRYLTVVAKSGSEKYSKGTLELYKQEHDDVGGLTPDVTIPDCMTWSTGTDTDFDTTKIKLVDNKPIIDFNTSDPSTYYDTYFESSPIPLNVTDFNITVNSGANVIALYQKDPRYNAALYGANVTDAGMQYMYPLDLAAPGQMRIFTDEDLAKDYPVTIPNVYGVYRNDEEHYFMYNESGDKIDLSNDINVEPDSNHETSILATVTSGDDIIKTISMTDEVNGTLWNTDGAVDEGDSDATAVQATDFVTWTDLLKALSTEKGIEIVSKKLKRLRDHMEFITDDTGEHTNVGLTDNYISFSTVISEDSTSGSNISSGKRLYISSTAPTGDIPDGSLGIGW